MNPTERKFRFWLGSLPEDYKWTLHNLVGHPLSEILHLLKKERLSNRVHSLTIPLVSTSYIPGDNNE